MCATKEKIIYFNERKKELIFAASLSRYVGNKDLLTAAMGRIFWLSSFKEYNS